MTPSKKQRVARKRNWKLGQLKAVMLFLKPYFDGSSLSNLESMVKHKIDKEWEIDKLRIKQNKDLPW